MAARRRERMKKTNSFYRDLVSRLVRRLPVDWIGEENEGKKIEKKTQHEWDQSERPFIGTACLCVGVCVFFVSFLLSCIYFFITIQRLIRRHATQTRIAQMVAFFFVISGWVTEFFFLYPSVGNGFSFKRRARPVVNTNYCPPFSGRFSPKQLCFITAPELCSDQGGTLNAE